MNFQKLIISRMARRAAMAAFAILAVIPVYGQAGIGMPIDWSFKHVIFTDSDTPQMAVYAIRDPRMLYNGLRRQRGRQERRSMSPAVSSSSGSQAKSSPNMQVDWSVSLGSGNVAQNMSPAKFTFNIHATPSCIDDFVVFGLNVAGVTGGQANLVGVNNLYSGASSNTCGVAPTVKFAYNVSTNGGSILTSPCSP